MCKCDPVVCNPVANRLEKGLKRSHTVHYEPKGLSVSFEAALGIVENDEIHIGGRKLLRHLQRRNLGQLQALSGHQVAILPKEQVPGFEEEFGDRCGVPTEFLHDLRPPLDGQGTRRTLSRNNVFHAHDGVRFTPLAVGLNEIHLLVSDYGTECFYRNHLAAAVHLGRRLAVADVVPRHPRLDAQAARRVRGTITEGRRHDPDRVVKLVQCHRLEQGPAIGRHGLDGDRSVALSGGQEAEPSHIGTKVDDGLRLCVNAGVLLPGIQNGRDDLGQATVPVSVSFNVVRDDVALGVHGHGHGRVRLGQDGRVIVGKLLGNRNAKHRLFTDLGGMRRGWFQSLEVKPRYSRTIQQEHPCPCSHFADSNAVDHWFVKSCHGE